MHPPPDREEILFSEALALPTADQRAAYLDRVCGTDSALRARLTALLAAHDTPATTLGMPAVRRTIHPDERLGGRIGPYLLLERIGEGGCGTVYLAEQQEPVRRQVALKVIKLGMDSAEVVARFEAERQALALMNHPNIANVLDAGATETGRPFFVMELVSGTRITTYCDENNLSVRERLELFIQVCHAIQHAHQKGIIHRDIKPSNILVTSLDGVPVPKVIDFGIAKATQGHLSDRTVLTAIAQFVGTPAYMSPEQAEFSGRDIDTRSDIYSLGVLLYELIAGRPPFDPDSLLQAGLDEIRRQIREVDPPRPSTRLSTLADADRTAIAQRRSTEPTRLATLLRSDLDWIAMRCLEKERARRYDTANALATDIQHHLNHEPVSATPPTAIYRTRKLVLRHKAFFAAAALVMLALLVGTIVSTWQAVRATRAERLASTRLQSELAARQDADRQRQVAVDQFAAATRAQHDAEKQRALAEERLRSETAARQESEHQKTLAEQERARAQTAEKVAQAEAEISRAVNEFLREDLLRQADSRTQISSQNMPDPNLTVRAALDRAAARVGPRFRRQPLVEAGIRDAIGKAYLGLGMFEQATEHFERVLELRKAELGPEHPATLDAMHQLGTAHTRGKRLSQAATLLEQTFAVRQRTLGPEQIDTLSTANSLAQVYASQRRNAEAVTLLEPVLEFHRRAFGPEHFNTLVLTANLATLYHGMGRVEEATTLFEENLAVKDRVLGRDHPDTLFTANNLGCVYLASGRAVDAARLFERAVEMRQRVLGSQHPETLQSTCDLASAYREQGRLEESAKLLEGAVETQSRVLSQEHPDTLVSLSNLGCTYWSQGRREEATEVFAKSARGWKRAYNVEHPETLRSMSNLAGVYYAQGRYDDAAPILHETLNVRQRVFGPKHRATFANARDLGHVHLRRGKYQEAENLLLRNCYDRLSDTEMAGVFANSRDVEELELTELLAELYTNWGNEEEAARWIRHRAGLHSKLDRWLDSRPIMAQGSPWERVDEPRKPSSATSRSSSSMFSSTSSQSQHSRTSTYQRSSPSSSQPPNPTTVTPPATETPGTPTSTNPETKPRDGRHAGFRPTPPDSSAHRHHDPGSGPGRPTPPAGGPPSHHHPGGHRVSPPGSPGGPTRGIGPQSSGVSASSSSGARSSSGSKSTGSSSSSSGSSSGARASSSSSGSSSGSRSSSGSSSGSRSSGTSTAPK